MAFDLLTRHQTPSRWSLGSFDEPLVWTPSAVKSEMMRILGIFDLTNMEASQALQDKKISEPEWKQWRQTYLASHQFLTSTSSLWGSNVLIARQHEQNALKWREFIASKGGHLQGPKNPGRSEDNWSTTDIALAIGGVAAVSMLITAFKKQRS